MTVPIAPVVRLGPREVVEGRTFTHPDHVPGDRAVLCMLIRDVNDQLVAAAGSDQPVTRYSPRPDAWYRRVVIPSPAALDDYDRITVVGFFGRIRDHVTTAAVRRIDELSARLFAAVSSTAGVLGYSTHLLADERNYANLVLVASPEVIERWRAAGTHQVAAEEASPDYYAHVRIYRGSAAPRDLAKVGAVVLDSVKYWDYRCDPVWHGIRTLA